jgi:hypothetical protein
VKISAKARRNLAVVATLELLWTFVQRFEGYRRRAGFGVKGLLWGAVPEQFPGPGVEFFHDVSDPGMGLDRQVSAVGKYWRISPLKFSLAPRCQGLERSAK